jgi:hypothetical protein
MLILSLTLEDDKIAVVIRKKGWMAPIYTYSRASS